MDPDAAASLPLDGPSAVAPGARAREVGAARAREVGAAPSDAREKALLVLGLLVFCFGGYYAVGLTGDPARAASLHTRLDDLIPFAPVFMYAYEGVYTALLYPVFVVRCRRLFRRVAQAYLVVIAACLLAWVAFPVTSAGLRADPAALDPARFHTWGLRVNYTLDPPMNLFPSLHLSITFLAALSAWSARRLWGVFGLVGTALVGVAICAVKQHYVLDGVAGLLLAWGAWLWCVRGYDRGESPPEAVAYDWRGPAVYAGVHLCVVLAFYAAFLAGWQPWA